MSERSLAIVGTSPRKIDAVDKVTGQTIYAGDISLPRMLHCKILRSTKAHARIDSVDLEKARQQQGVYAVLSGRDLSKPFGILRASEDETPLAVDKVRFIGDPIAAVAAVDEETAEAALRQIVVEYSPLDDVMGIQEAVRQPAGEPIHDQTEQNNIQRKASLQFGNFEQGFADADLIQEDYFFYDGNTHLAMEEHASLARYTPDGKLTLWTSSQTPHYLHRTMASYFNLPASHVRIVAPPNGGGFGGKSEPFNHEFIVARLAMLTGRPVKIVLTREEVFYLHRGRHPTLMRLKTGVKRDGAITAMDFESILDGGAYGSYGIVTMHYVGAIHMVSYNIPAYRYQGARIHSNKPPCGPKRGHGAPQSRYALEVQLDKIAEKLGLNPLDIRLHHLIRPFTRTANHLSVTTTALDRCMDAVATRSQFRQGHGQLPLGKGIGFATGAYISGASLPVYANKMPHSIVQVILDRGGGVTVYSGSTDIGQGSDSILAMLVAEELGVSLEHIRVVSSDTDITPVDLGSFSSRVTLMAGQAAVQAAAKLRTVLLTTAAGFFAVPVGSVDTRENFIYCAKDETRRIGFPELVKLAEAQHGPLAATGSYTPPYRGGDYRGAAFGPSPTYSYSACVVALDIALETGEIQIEKIWLAHDVGKAINPVLVEGQIEGSIYMAIGEALMETCHFRRGLHRTPSMLDYKTPTFLEMPEIESILIESNDPDGPFGAKEAGQGPQLPVVPAIANAVYDAVGIRIDETPITAEKVLKALQLKAAGSNPRIGPDSMPKVAYPTSVEAPSTWGEPVLEME